MSKGSRGDLFLEIVVDVGQGKLLFFFWCFLFFLFVQKSIFFSKS